MGEGNWVELEAAQIERLAGPFEWKAVSYADFAAYGAGLAVEVAAGWEPFAVTSHVEAAAEDILVTYRRVPV